MAKLRSVSTAFWSDPFVEDLTPSHKLLFLYLITNEKTNMLGIYESSIRKISFETGLKKEDVSNGLKAFERVGKVKYVNNYVILINYMKHQNFNTNMKKSAIDVYNNLPKELKDNKLNIDKSNPFKGFESLLNHFGMVRKVEVEVEVEVEYETKDEKNISFDVFWDLYDKKIGAKDCKLKWNKLDIETQQKIIDFIPTFLISIKDKQFLPHPKTFLNQERWNDEIVVGKQTSVSNEYVSYLTEEDKKW